MKNNNSIREFFKNNLFHVVFLFSSFAILVVSTITINNVSDTVVNMNSAKDILNSTERFLINNYSYRLHASAAAAQQLMSESDLEMLRIKPGSPDSPGAWLENREFLALRDVLVRFADENGLENVHYYFRIDSFVQPLINTDSDIIQAYTPSNHLIMIEEGARRAWNEKDIIVANREFLVSDDGLLTAYAPIFDGNGDVFALVGVDIKDEQINPMRDQIVFLSERIEALSSRITILVIAMISALLLLVTGGVITFQNQRKSSKIMKEALLHAENASNAKSLFLANMSHEMRTPLNAIIGMTNIGNSSNDIERKGYSLRKIESASRHLLGVINDVLDYSKIEAGKLEINAAEFRFEKMIKKVCDVVAFRATEKKQSFDVDMDANIPRSLIGDEQRMSQVITNLLSNAMKFTPENGSITLTSRLAGVTDGYNLVEVKVADTGIGISDEQKSRIFRSFEQADNTITKQFGGTGLGLAISKSIIESMGGTITFESELGKGSVFGFVVPLISSPELDADSCLVEPELNPVHACDFSGRCVLLVDDIEINREIVIALLEPSNISIDSAENGAIAVEMFAADPDRYDIVFMDVQMPQMDGYQATKAIRDMDIDKAKTVPIIAMTANVFKEDIEKCLAAGMNGHLGKPLDFGEVIKKLIEHV